MKFIPSITEIGDATKNEMMAGTWLSHFPSLSALTLPLSFNLPHQDRA
jgi:hypothetical protein